MYDLEKGGGNLSVRRKVQKKKICSRVALLLPLLLCSVVLSLATLRYQLTFVQVGLKMYAKSDVHHLEISQLQFLKKSKLVDWK